MGTKRKASIFEDDSLPLHQNARPTTPSLASSSPLSTSTIQSSSDNARTFDFYRVKAVPYLNTRTRKRHRDDRPDVETIHENTLRKLFDAQRFHLDEAMPLSDVMALEERGEATEEEDADMTDDVPAAEIPRQIEPDQKSIDAFFGWRGGMQLKVPTTHASDGHQGAIWAGTR